LFGGDEMRILVVDDEKTLLGQLERALEGQRYMVETALHGQEALDKVFETPYDLIILDIMLPKKDGLSVLREIRQAEMTTPVLMLTARGEIGDKIKGLDLGADDYLAKPFSLDKLLARIRALLRRSGGQADSVLQVKDLRLDTVSREVTKAGKSVELTAREFSILESSSTTRTGPYRVSAWPSTFGEMPSILSACPISWMFTSKTCGARLETRDTAPSSEPFAVSGILSRMKPNDRSTENFPLDHGRRFCGQLDVFRHHIVGDDGTTAVDYRF
jgi:CheY-like chemotaxis protein